MGLWATFTFTPPALRQGGIKRYRDTRACCSLNYRMRRLTGSHTKDRSGHVHVDCMWSVISITATQRGGSCEWDEYWQTAKLDPLMRCAAENSPYSITERRVPELIQVLRSQPAGGTGLCSYRVRGVDGSCTEHLTVESYMVFICKQSYLLLFGIPSPTHSFIPGLKPSFSANPSHCSPSFFFFNIHYMDSPDCLPLFLSISVFCF